MYDTESKAGTKRPGQPAEGRHSRWSREMDEGYYRNQGIEAVELTNLSGSSTN